MTDKENKTCFNLRECLDKIDSELMDCLEKRMRLVSDFFKTCSRGAGDIPFYPDLEAGILRRALMRNAGELHPVVLAKIWRELISASAQMCRPFSVAVYTKEHHKEMMDLAGDYFGTTAAYVMCPSSVRQVLQSISSLEAGAGVVPVFSASDEAWWLGLNIPSEHPVEIVAKLPFVRTFHAGDVKPEGYVVSFVPLSPSGGADVSLLLLEMHTQLSMGALKQAFEGASFSNVHILNTSFDGNVYTAVVETDGFVDQTDNRIVLFSASHEKEIIFLRRIGGYVREIVLNSDNEKGIN